MISDEELWNKCINGEKITGDDLDTPIGARGKSLILDCGTHHYYSDGLHWYDKNGHIVDLKIQGENR